MFYTYSYTPTTDNTADAPEKLKMPLTKGIIHQVDVLFQSGCNHLEFVQIWNDNFQVWPSNRGEKIRGNATVISFRDFYELEKGNTDLTAHIWTDQDDPQAEIIIQIGLLPKSILQPLSFEELLKAAAGTT